MKEVSCIRQGDVLLRAVVTPDSLAGLTQKADAVVAYGEHSGHAHVATGDAQVFELDGKLYVSVGHDGGELQHLHLPTGRKADHHSLVLEPSTVYEVILQNQYNPYSRFMERVAD
jgi:hypothetical protein